MKRSKMPARSFAVPGEKKYPVTSVKQARNAIARVEQHGSPAEKKAVYSKVKSKYPALAKRSTVIPTKGGTGRHVGQPKGKRNAK